MSKYNADQIMLSVRHRVHDRVFALKGDMSASSFIEMLLEEKESRAVVRATARGKQVEEDLQDTGGISNGKK